MKRILTIAMCVVMLVGVMAAFAGCDDKTTEQTTTTTTQSTTTTTKQDEITTTTQVQTTTEPATTTTTKQETTVTTREATTTTKKPTTTTTTKKTTTSTTVQGVVSERDALIGSWSTKLDMTAEINEAYEESDLKGYVEISDFSFKVVFTFKANGTYSVRVDQAAAETMYANARSAYEKGLRKYLSDLLKENDVDMTVDEYLAGHGSSMEKMVDYEFPMEMLDYLIEAYKTDGLYEVENGIIYANYDLESEIDKTDEDQYSPYTISGNTLTLHSSGEGDESITLTRVK